MLAVDTNAVVRLLVDDDDLQQRAVRDRLRRTLAAGEKVLVSAVVLAEVTWVLDSVYGYGRDEIAAAVEAIAETPPCVTESPEVVRQAVAWYGQGPADLADYLILAKAEAHGARALLTFDRGLLGHAACEIP